MIEGKEYYTAPSDEVFNEIKRCSKAIWTTYDDEYGYATEKIDEIKDMENVKDNYAFLVAMFDEDNQRKLIGLLSGEARELVIKLLN